MAAFHHYLPLAAINTTVTDLPRIGGLRFEDALVAWCKNTFGYVPCLAPCDPRGAGILFQTEGDLLVFHLKHHGSTIRIFHCEDGTAWLLRFD